MNKNIAKVKNCLLKVFNGTNCFICLIFLFTTFAFCSPVKSTDKDMISHWVRSDDLNEYQGLYLYSLEKSSKLFMTNYSKDKFYSPDRSICVGYWLIDGDTLIWNDKEKKNSIIYIMGNDGIYWEKESKYYVPVKLVPVSFQNNIPIIQQQN